MSQTHKCRGVATTVQHNKDGIYVTYHNTRVVDYDKVRGTLILNTNGWKTRTTLTRMNQASNEFKLGYGVYQKKFQWYITYKGMTHLFDNDSIEIRL